MAKQAQGEKTLLESEEHFRSVAETAAEAIITIYQKRCQCKNKNRRD